MLSTKYFFPLNKLKAICILIVLGLLVYINILTNGFVWDDDGQIVNNVMVHSLENVGMLFTGSTFGFSASGQLSGIYYRPMMSTFFAIIYTIFGSSPFFFHLFQLILHIGNAVLIFLFFKYFFSSSLSLVLAAIFLVHPINSETVEYIANTGDVLFLFFGMIAIFILKKKFISSLSAASGGLLLLWSLFSKETGLLFLPVIFLWKWLFYRKNMVKIALIFGSVITIYLLNRFGLAHIYFNKPDSTPISSLDLLHRMINVPQIIFYYLSQFIFPIHLSIAQLWIVKSINISTFWIPLLVDAMVLIPLTFIGFNFGKHDRQYLKDYVFFCCWFVLGLLIYLQIMPLDMTVADRWFYFPIVGLLGIIGILLTKLVAVYPRLRVWIILLSSIVILLFSTRTIIRNQDWHNAATLFRHDLSVSKNNYELEILLAYELNKSENYQESLTYSRNSIKHFPTYSGWSNLGVSEIKLGNINQGIIALKNAYALQPYENVAQNLSYALLMYKPPQEAKEFIQQQVVKFPNNPYFWFYFAMTDYKLDNTSDAISAARQCYALSSGEKCKVIYSYLQQNQKIPPEVLKALLN